MCVPCEEDNHQHYFLFQTTISIEIYSNTLYSTDKFFIYT